MTYKSNYKRFEVLGELMFSNVMIVGVFIFLLIAYMDQFQGSPTDTHLLGSLVRRNPLYLDSLRLSHIPHIPPSRFRYTQMIFFMTIIYFITGIVWFRKAIINIFTLAFYIYISIHSKKVCYTPDVGFGINSPKNNSYPLFQLLPDYDSFKYNLSCTTATEERRLNVLYIALFLLYLACTYPSYLFERTARIEFWKHRKQ